MAVKSILENFGLKSIDVISDAVERRQPNFERATDYIKENGWQDKKIIATTSALVQHKDPVTMVNAIAAMSALRSDFVFLHFGDGVLKPVIEKLIIEKKLTPKQREKYLKEEREF